MTDRPSFLSERQFIRRVLILITLAAVSALLFLLSRLVILVFGSVVVAVLLTAIGRPLQRWTGLPRGLSLLLAVLLLLGAIGLATASLGSQVAAQAQQLGELLPAAWDQVQARLGSWGITLPDIGAASASGQTAPASTSGAIGELNQDLLGRVGRLLMGVFSGIADTLLVIVGGIYLAVEAELYRTGSLKLFPKRRWELVSDVFDHSGRSLRLWLLGTFISMVAVGALTWIGLRIIGVPSALALALLAAIFEFVPFIGPVAAAVPAILIAFTQGFDMVLWTLALYVAVQQVEGNVIQPVAQRYAVDMPPALLLFSIVAGGYLFGILGIIFAAPLTVVAFVLIKRLYIQETLHTDTTLPDEK